MQHAAATLFWLGLGLVAYTYAVYPLAVWLLARLRPMPLGDPRALAEWPHLTVVLVAHDEAARLPAKLDNLRALDYPAGRLHVVVVSDGSRDGTAEWLWAQPDLQALVFAERRGKASCLNDALTRVDTPVVVLCDARQRIEPGALRFLVASLLQPGVGAVSAALVHASATTHAAADAGLYWRYERWIRASESRLRSTLGATGALYALRREHCTPLPPDTVLDDFVLPMRVVKAGQRVLLDGRARIVDTLQADAGREQRRKARTLAGLYQALAREHWMWSPRRNPLFVQFLSHKVARLLVPYALALSWAASALAAGAYLWAFALQSAFYMAALAALAWPAQRRFRLLSFCAVFVQLNWAAVLGLHQFLRRRVDPRWERV